MIEEEFNEGDKIFCYARKDGNPFRYCDATISHWYRLATPLKKLHGVVTSYWEDVELCVKFKEFGMYCFTVEDLGGSDKDPVVFMEERKKPRKISKIFYVETNCDIKTRYGEIPKGTVSAACDEVYGSVDYISLRLLDLDPAPRKGIHTTVKSGRLEVSEISKSEYIKRFKKNKVKWSRKTRINPEKFLVK